MPIFAQECIIETGRNIFISRSNFNDSFIKESSCPLKIEKEFNSFVRSSNGSMRSSDIERVLKEKGYPFVEVRPTKIKSHRLERALKKSLELPVDWKLANIKVLEKYPLVFIEEDVEMKTFCENCKSLGKKQIRLEFASKEQKKNYVKWVKGEILVEARVLIAKRNIPFNNKALSTKDFIERNIYTSNPEKLFLKKNEINFYKSNKNIAKGSLLHVSNVAPVKLVSPREFIDVFYNKNNFLLKAKAQSMESGHYGDVIEVKRKNSPHVIVGRVVGHGQVMVEI